LGRGETTRHLRRYHFAHPGTAISLCGGGFVLDTTTSTEPEAVPRSLRCSARPCVSHWKGVAAVPEPRGLADLDPQQVIRHGIALDPVDAAEARRCPRCRRKYALRLTPTRTIQCRWENCGYVASLSA
jgi:hypothetical protein